MGSRAQRGQAIVLVAVMVGVVVGMAALAIDGSRAYTLRRDMQNAADYASLAAADSFQRTGSYSTAESTAATGFGTQMRLYAPPSCTPFGAPGPGTWTVTCTYSDGTTLVESMPVKGAQGAQFMLTATQTLALQFGRILTNGTTPQISATAGARVGNLLYSPAVAALDQAGCGGAGGTAVTINGTGSLKLVGDLVSDGTVSVPSGTAVVTGDVYARCQASVSGVSPVCYPSGAAPACTYPDVAGVVRSGYHYVDPGYPAPSVGPSQPVPGSNVVVTPGVYTSNVNITGNLCFFLAGGVYDFLAGAVNTGALVSNELKPPDEPTSSNNTILANPQFWNSSGARCAGSAQYTAVQCTGNNNCGTGNCGNGNGNGQGNGCAAAPPGDWSFEVTSTRTDTYNGNAYQRESAPSTCHTVHVGNNQAVQLIVSNVPGATSYNIYAAPPGTFCNGPFGLADILPVSGPVQNDDLAGCPAFTGTACSLGFETIIINGMDIGSPWAPNAAASPGTTGAYPPNSETAPLIAGHPNQNPARLAGAAGDRANENNCETTAGAYSTCPAAVTAGAVELYFPGSSCLATTNLSDTYLFSGYQYDWIVAYAPPTNHCANSFGADQNSALIGLTYMPGGSFAVLDTDTFDTAGTGGIIADTLSFTGTLPAISFSSSYAPVPFAARLIS